MKYIAILRGINVSGKNIIKMTELKSMMEAINFNNVITYIQSGNIIFDSPINDLVEIKSIIEKNIQKKFKLNIPVIVLTKSDLKKIIQKNPFLKDKDPSLIYYTFLAENTNVDLNKANELIDAKLSDKETYLIGDKIVYVYCANGYGKTNIHNMFLEKVLKVTATSRNLKTTHQLLSLAENSK